MQADEIRNLAIHEDAPRGHVKDGLENFSGAIVGFTSRNCVAESVWEVPPRSGSPAD